MRICLTMVDLPLSPAPSMSALTVRLSPHTHPLLVSIETGAGRSEGRKGPERKGDSRLLGFGAFQLLIDRFALLLSVRDFGVDRLSAAHLSR